VGPDHITKNRGRLLQADVAKELLARLATQASAQALTSDEHFMLDRALLEAWAEAKNCQTKEVTRSAAAVTRQSSFPRREVRAGAETVQTFADQQGKVSRQLLVSQLI
jgi:hypothetical protein